MRCLFLMALAVPVCAVAAGPLLPPPPSPFIASPTDGRWRGNLGAAVAATAGNTSTRSLLVNADGVRQTELDRISLVGFAQYADSSGDLGRSTTAHRLGGFVRYDLNIDDRRFTFGKLTFERDRLRQLSLRTALDTGLGYKLFDTQALRTSVFVGIGYTADRYDSPQSIDARVDSRFARTSLYLAEESAHELTSTVRVRQRLESNSGVSGDKAQLVRFTANLDVAMTSSMSLSIGFIDAYNSRPPAGQQRNDLSLFTGVNVKFDGR